MAGSPPQLKHVGVYVADIERMRRFYGDVLGMVETDTGEVARYGNAPIVFLSADASAHHQLVLLQWPEGMERGPSTVNQLSFAVESLPQIRDIHDRLKQERVTKLLPINHGTSISLYSEDPEGNGLEIYMDLPWYISQPHGDPLDLSLSDEEIMRRTEEMVRADPSFRPFADWSSSINEKIRQRAGQEA
ncbi:hypothetical protein L288_14375 [Sphingobium quisquiliarum P25]|uniref:VOC domain-containing protein n=1 Tax=Sphingobium quisquiliarum P25 TaxID=1329909 RepID=T0GKF7_9SPHN|nr:MULTISPECIES: VOC family protein [Sphingobium]EQB04261.1 hypothetical protein L288_14375 [Sphingobium quisquiliarum P25]EZP71079.1 Glyoxalase/bleomycin resistance protein/dioxygenase [Sphingomonas paucimobilis]